MNFSESKTASAYVREHAPKAPYTPRELQVAKLSRDGLKSPQIAERLGISLKMVHEYRSRTKELWMPEEG